MTMAPADDSIVLIRASAQRCLDLWKRGETSDEHCFTECSVSLHSSEDVLQVVSFPSSTLDSTLQVIHVHHLETGDQSAASALVRGESRSGWMVLLRDAGAWKTISATFGDNSNRNVTSEAFQGVLDCCWNGYCAANRACDGAKMATVFHPTSRLTFIHDGLQVKSSSTFCDMVERRYTSNPMHRPYSHLEDDPVVAQADSLRAVEFATDGVALVTLRVGHPPFLWTDLLTCARVEGKWWIVHKSSVSDPFLTHLAHQSE